MGKKIGILAMALASTTLISSPVLAASEVPEGEIVPISAEIPADQVELISKEIQNQDDTSDYIRVKGVITDIIKNGDTLKLIVENQEKESVTHLILNEDVLAFSSATTNEFARADFEKGLEIEAYYDKNKPMILIYPPQIVPELLIVHDEEKMGQVKVGKFDDNWLSLDGKLQLHVSDETELVNQKGEAITKEELSDKELLVFYTVTTRSLPPQTTPSKIAALDPLNDEIAELDKLIEADHYIKNDIKMVPLRKVAEHLGNEVVWDPESQTILVKKLNRTFTISIGNEQYGYNRSIRHFQQAPELNEQKTYVSIEFVIMLLN